MAQFARKVDADEHFGINKKLDEEVGDGQVVVIKQLVLQVKSPTIRTIDVRKSNNNVDQRIPLLLEQTPGGLELVAGGVFATPLWLVVRELVIFEGWRLHVETAGAFPGADSSLDVLFFSLTAGGGVLGG